MMRFYTLLLSIALFTHTVQSQNNLTLTADNSIQSNELSVLADKNYTFEQIRNDTALKFSFTETWSTDSADAYWIKLIVKNPFPYAEKYMVEVLPMLDNTLYYFNENEKQWRIYSNGLLVNNRQRNIWLMPCVVQGQSTTTLYIKSNIKPLRASKTLIQPAIWLEKERYIAENEQFIALATWATVFVFIIFLLYNAYIYFVFRDKTYLYYLIVQIGGLMFIIADQFYFNSLMPFRFCVADVKNDGLILFHDINALATDIGLSLILFGYVQITRIYLDTINLMPRQDKLLKYLLTTYLFITLIITILFFSKILPLSKTPYLITNLAFISVVLTIFYIAIVSYRRRYTLARYFLMANAVSISIILLGSFYYFFIDVVTTTDHAVSAKIAVIAQAFCLALALSQRVLLIREALKQKELETQELLLKNNLQQAQNDLLKEKLTFNQRELASNTLYISQKNELLRDLKTNMQTLGKALPNAAQTVFKNIESVIQNNLYLDSDWERFRIHFEQVHPDFFKNLQTEYPTLTNNEIRLCAYFHLNLSTKEIAALLNIDPASVRTARMRLNKKMNKIEVENN
jgi:hypothetical protein